MCGWISQRASPPSSGGAGGVEERGIAASRGAGATGTLRLQARAMDRVAPGKVWLTTGRQTLISIAPSLTVSSRETATLAS